MAISPYYRVHSKVIQKEKTDRRYGGREAKSWEVFWALLVRVTGMAHPYMDTFINMRAYVCVPLHTCAMCDYQLKAYQLCRFNLLPD